MNGAARPRIAVLDYGMGNLRSVEKALEKAGADAHVTADRDEASAADAILLPGVGAFPRAMGHIRERGFDTLTNEVVADGRPLLGICLGMQLLFESSTEQGGDTGLGLIEGEVTGLETGGLRLPHIGWETITITGDAGGLADDSADGEAFYFNHSFAVRPRNDADIVATARWGEEFPCIVRRGNVYGAQFHPEKSGPAGLRLLSGFVRLAGRLQS